MENKEVLRRIEAIVPLRGLYVKRSEIWRFQQKMKEREREILHKQK